MTNSELIDLLDFVQTIKAETQTIELKAATGGCPSKLYDTLSSFSNQDDGGTIIFGIDEKNKFDETGVYDSQDLIKHVTEQCNQMEPVVRPLFTTVTKGEKVFVSAEIPGMDVADRPCFYSGRGRIKGSYIRVGDADELMTEYEIYSYEAFRKKYQDDIRPVERATLATLNADLLGRYMDRLKADRPNLAGLSDDKIYELMSITRNGVPTITAVLLFSMYPQAYFPQLCITAVAVPGKEIGDIGSEGERFLDNQRIEGTLPQMLDEAISFVKKNTRSKTIVDSTTGKRKDKPEYPVTAVREVILNALVHRDYSMHTEGKPIQLNLFEDRMEVQSPGGLYGRLSIDQLGKVQPDTRNPVLAVAMEMLGETENRYSGIPTIRKELEQVGLPEPEFLDERGTFIVRFSNADINKDAEDECAAPKDLLQFCAIPRSRNEIASFLGIKTVSYAMKVYVKPLLDSKKLRPTNPEKPKSSNQRYVTIK